MNNDTTNYYLIEVYRQSLYLPENISIHIVQTSSTTEAILRGFDMGHKISDSVIINCVVKHAI